MTTVNSAMEKGRLDRGRARRISDVRPGWRLKARPWRDSGKRLPARRGAALNAESEKDLQAIRVAAEMAVAESDGFIADQSRRAVDKKQSCTAGTAGELIRRASRRREVGAIDTGTRALADSALVLADSRVTGRIQFSKVAEAERREVYLPGNA
jgi:hypothetical protein